MLPLRVATAVFFNFKSTFTNSPKNHQTPIWATFAKKNHHYLSKSSHTGDDINEPKIFMHDLRGSISFLHWSFIMNAGANYI